MIIYPFGVLLLAVLSAIVIIAIVNDAKKRLNRYDADFVAAIDALPRVQYCDRCHRPIDPASNWGNCLSCGDDLCADCAGGFDEHGQCKLCAGS